MTPPVAEVARIVCHVGVDGPDAVPEPVRRLGALPGAQYADSFTLAAVDSAASARRWASTMFDDIGGAAAQRLWRWVLQMKLDPVGAPGTVAGWRLAAAESTFARMETRSPFARTHLVVSTDDDAVTFATLVRSDHRVAAQYWDTIAHLHRRAAPGLMRAAAARLSRSTS